MSETMSEDPIVISEENRGKAQRGENVLLGTYTCSRCNEPIQHWYRFDRWARSTQHTSRCGFDDYKEHAECSQGRDKKAEDALVEEYYRIYYNVPARKAAEATRKAEAHAYALKHLKETQDRLDTHARCRVMAETIFALDHRVKPAEALERARVFVDYYDAEERSLREAHEYAEAQKARIE